MIQWKALILCPCWHCANHKCNLVLYGSYHSLWQRRKVFSSKQAAWLHHMVFCICVWCDVSKLKLMKMMMVIIFIIIMARGCLLFMLCYYQPLCPHSPTEHIFILSKARLMESPGEKFWKTYEESRPQETRGWMLDDILPFCHRVWWSFSSFFRPAWDPNFRNVMFFCEYKRITEGILFCSKWWKTYTK